MERAEQSNAARGGAFNATPRRSNLFADDPARGARMAAEAAGVYLDYSKNRIDETLKLLIELAEQ